MMTRDPQSHRETHKHIQNDTMQCGSTINLFFAQTPPTYPASVVPTHGAGEELERGRHRRAAPRLHKKSRNAKERSLVRIDHAYGEGRRTLAPPCFTKRPQGEGLLPAAMPLKQQTGPSPMRDRAGGDLSPNVHGLLLVCFANPP